LLDHCGVQTGERYEWPKPSGAAAGDPLLACRLLGDILSRYADGCCAELLAEYRDVILVVYGADDGA